MNRETYVPTPQEQENVEEMDSNVLLAQYKNQERVRAAGALQEKGLKGELTYKTTAYVPGNYLDVLTGVPKDPTRPPQNNAIIEHITGDFEGKTVLLKKVQRWDDVEKQWDAYFSGSLDGVEIPEEDTERLLEELRKYAMDFSHSSITSFMAQAHGEREKEQKEVELKRGHGIAEDLFSKL